MRAAKRDRPPTIIDVARLAEVSLPTVSRVLTGSTPVRDGTRARVLAAMRELGYRPNGAARALVQGRQPIVGVITQDVTSCGAGRMIKSIEEAARRAGYVVAIAVLDPGDLAGTGHAVDVLLGQPIVGVIVLDFHRYDPQALRTKLGGLEIATVTGGDDADVEFRHVVVDDRRGALEVTEYLLALGHETVHHVGVPGSNGRPHPREVGWHEALVAAGAPVPDVMVTDRSVESGRAAGAVLARDPSVTAIFCWNDELAFGVMRSLHENGRNVPGDVSVAGMDDDPLAAVYVPSLTTCRLDWEWAGATALGVLLNPDRSKASPGTPSPRVIERDSTAPPPQRAVGD